MNSPDFTEMVARISSRHPASPGERDTDGSCHWKGLYGYTRLDHETCKVTVCLTATNSAIMGKARDYSRVDTGVEIAQWAVQAGVPVELQLQLDNSAGPSRRYAHFKLTEVDPDRRAQAA